MFHKLSDHLKAKYSRKNDLSRQLEIVKVFDIYKEEIKKIFGDEKKIKPLSLRNKILKVGTESSAAASELRMHEGRILRKINSLPGKELVKRIVYQF